MSTHSAADGTPDNSPSTHPDEPVVEPIAASETAGDGGSVAETPDESVSASPDAEAQAAATDEDSAVASAPEVEVEPETTAENESQPEAAPEVEPAPEAPAAPEAEAKTEAAEKPKKAKAEARKISPSEQRFRDAKNQHETLEGRVIGWNKGGLHVVIDDLTAFCPRSEIELGEPADSGSYVDQTLEFKVLKIQDKGRRVVVSRAAAMRSARSRNIRKLKKKLEVGTVLHGIVNSLTDFGAFIDLGGIQGLLHVSEISFDQVRSPADVLEVGQEVEVKVIKLESGGKRISLSMKALKPDPWKGVGDRFTEGELVNGTVERTTRFGVFVQLEPGLTGLLPMAEMNLPRDASPARVFPPGRQMKVQVVSVDHRRRRISLAAEGSNLEGSRADYRSYKSSHKDSGFHPFAAALKNLR